jgi:hypothetical protein
VQGIVPVGGLRYHARESPAHARRLVDRQLFLQRDMQAEVQERVRLAELREIFPVPETFRRLEYAVVFGMQQNGFERQRLDPGEPLAAAVLAPRLEEQFPDLLTRGIEHCFIPSFWG